MGKNRFRPSKIMFIRNGIAVLTDFLLDTLVYLRSTLKALCVFGLLFGVLWGALHAAKRSPYFMINQVRVENTQRLSRATILDALQLNIQGNYFSFDRLAARNRLLEHDWVADVAVETALPNRLTVRVQEREPVAIVALNELYLVDHEGKVFAKADDVEALPHLAITGLDKGWLKSNPTLFMHKVRTALALARQFDLSDASAYRKLDSIHLDESGRWELMLGATHVILGENRFDDRLAYLADVLKTMENRKVGAEYIMISPELNRAIVKETARTERATELTLRTYSELGETR